MAAPNLDLFKYAAGFVSVEDIAKFAPNDPGYENYVREFTQILKSGALPPRADFDITETIGLTRWSNPDREKNPVRYRRFRTFTNAVGVALCVASQRDDDSLPANYSAISLFDDACALHDRKLLSLLLPTFEEFYKVLYADNSAESLFLLLGYLLGMIELKSPEPAIDEVAARIMNEEPEYEEMASKQFLWGRTFFDPLHSVWKRYSRELLISPTPAVTKLRRALLPDESAS
jgi:hypothetical protein